MAVMYLYLADTEFDRAEAIRRLEDDSLAQKSLATEMSEADAPRM
jgi:hypothetical protein